MKRLLVFIAVTVISGLSYSYAQNTHCYAKIVAVSDCGSTVEVKKWEKGGYMGCPICTPKCQDYARGLWDATSQADFILLAKKAALCGSVKLVLTSSCGTCDYGPELRTTTINLGGSCVTKCDCPPGFTYDPADGNCKKQLCAVQGATNQSLGPNFFIHNGYIYQIGKKTNCRKVCQ